VKLYKTIYCQNTKYLKDPGFYHAFNAYHNVFGLYDPQLHRARRRILNPMFSRGGIFKVEGLIHDKYEIMENKILRLCKKSPTIDVYDAFRALTTEIVAQFAFSRSAGLIEESRDDFKSRTVDAIEGTADGLEYMRHFPLLRLLSEIMPRKLVARLGGDVGRFMSVLDVSLTHKLIPAADPLSPLCPCGC
jgi:cytochrome P450